MTLALSFTLVAAALTIVLLANRSSSRGAAVEDLRGVRDQLTVEVERLRPLESRLAAANATIAAKEEAWERTCAQHDGTVTAIDEQKETLTEVSERLNALQTKTEAAATTGRDAAEGSRAQAN